MGAGLSLWEILAPESTPKLSRDEFIKRMRQKMEETLGQVADAINEAPPGPIIAGSEERVRDLFADPRQHAYETGLQLRCESMRRKPLFPPPKDHATGKTRQNKGRQDFTALTINGRARLWPRRWHCPREGSSTPLDAWLDTRGRAISRGVREMACRLDGDGKDFDKAAANLARAARVPLGGETSRVLVETEGKRVSRARRSERLPVAWSATERRVGPRAKTTRLYLGGDGVMVPLVTEAEKTARRRTLKRERRRRGQGARPLPPKKRGADQSYKGSKIVAFHDEAQAPRLVRGTRGDCDEAGRWMRRRARRIRLDLADQKGGNVAGSPRIRNQIRRRSPPPDGPGLDFYHLGENVPKARREIYGEGDESGQGWAGRWLPVSKHGGGRAGLEAVARMACRSASGPCGGGPAGELRRRTACDDQVPGVPSPGLADRRRPARSDVQDADDAAERLGDAPGWRERRGPHGPGSPDAERPMGRVREKSATANGLSSPGSFATPKMHSHSFRPLASND